MIYWVVDYDYETVGAYTTEEEAEQAAIACDGDWYIEE